MGYMITNICTYLLGNEMIKHQNVNMAERAMWGLLNPRIEKHIDKQKVSDFLNELAWLAINLPLNYHEHECEEAE